MPDTRFVALLRGINVGRAKRIAMADLRALLAGLGYANVQTHLQSGNAVFSSDSGQDSEALAATIEQALARELHLSCAVVVREAGELAKVLAQNPLRTAMTDPARMLVGFFVGEPDAERVRAVLSRDLTPNLLHIDGRTLYIWCPNGILESPFASIAWEREVGAAATMRNWTTMQRLERLAQG